MWEKHSFLLFFANLCFSQQAATQALRSEFCPVVDAEGCDADKLMRPLDAVFPLQAESHASPSIPGSLSPGDAKGDSNFGADEMRPSQLTEAVILARQLPTQDAAWSSQLEVLSSEVADLNAVASALETFTPGTISISPTSDSTVTATQDPQSSSTAQPSSLPSPSDSSSQLASSPTLTTAQSDASSSNPTTTPSQTTSPSSTTAAETTQPSTLTTSSISSSASSTVTTDITESSTLTIVLSSTTSPSTTSSPTTSSPTTSSPTTSSSATSSSTNSPSSSPSSTVTTDVTQTSTLTTSFTTTSPKSTSPSSTVTTDFTSTSTLTLDATESTPTKSETTSSKSSTSSSESPSSPPSQDPTGSSQPTAPSNGTTTPANNGDSSLNTGQIAGLSVGVCSAALLGFAGLIYWLRRRHGRLAAERVANQVYPEEAYLYDPPITPPPEAAERPPRLGGGPDGGGVFVTHQFGTNAGGNQSGDSFHTAGNSNSTGPYGGNGGPESYPSDPLQSADNEHTGLIGGAAAAGGAAAGGRAGAARLKRSSSPNFSQPTAYTNTYPNNGVPIHQNAGPSASTQYSPLSPRHLASNGGSAFPVASSARPLAYGLGVSTRQAASQAAQARSRDLASDPHPSYAVSPSDIRRDEHMPLSPDGEAGDLGNGRDGVTFGGAVSPGIGRVRKAWGW